MTTAASSPAIRESSLARPPTSARRSAALFEPVCARDPLEQPLSSPMRLSTADVSAVGVTVNHVRKYEPESETLAQASRDRDCLDGTGGLVNCAHDGLHRRSLKGLAQ
jgi:hypothetical protein